MHYSDTCFIIEWLRYFSIKPACTSSKTGSISTDMTPSVFSSHHSAKWYLNTRVAAINLFDDLHLLSKLNKQACMCCLCQKGFSKSLKKIMLSLCSGSDFQNLLKEFTKIFFQKATIKCNCRICVFLIVYSQTFTFK